MSRSDQQKPPHFRRSAGMLRSPHDANTPSIPTTPPKVRPESRQPQRVSASPYPAPKVLMGEVAAPAGKYASGGVGQEPGRRREALRAFMQARRLSPTQWARAAGVPPGEILGFLTAKARSIPQATLEKLALAAHCAVDDLFR